MVNSLRKCFSTAWTRPGTGTWTIFEILKFSESNLNKTLIEDFSLPNTSLKLNSGKTYISLTENHTFLGQNINKFWFTGAVTYQSCLWPGLEAQKVEKHWSRLAVPNLGNAYQGAQFQVTRTIRSEVSGVQKKFNFFHKKNTTKNSYEEFFVFLFCVYEPLVKTNCISSYLVHFKNTVKYL
jgi:hypothetical protein